MRRFEFKLEPLYDYRMRLEDICKSEFSTALKRLEDEETKLELIKEIYRKSASEIDEMKENGAPIEEFSLHYAYITKLKAHIDAQEKIITEVRADYEAKREKLAEASKKKKVVELVRERSYGSFVEKQNRAEQKAADDMTSSRFTRKENT